jgi:hypothetical protein
MVIGGPSSQPTLSEKSAIANWRYNSREDMEAAMSLLEKLNLSGKSCKLPITERMKLFAAEKAKIKAITEGLGCAADEYGDMLSHEIAEMVLAEIEKPVKPGSLHELHGGVAFWWRPFGSKEKLVEFLTPFLAADSIAQPGNPSRAPE